MIKLPPGWAEVHAKPENWPDVDMMDKLAYASGDHSGGGIIYLRPSYFPGVKWFVRSHERGHAWQWFKRRDMWHTKEPSIMAERYSFAWWITPIVSLFRWSWWDKETRSLIDD